MVKKKNDGKKKHTSAADLRPVHTEFGRYEKNTKSFKKEINNAKVLFADLSHSVEQLSFNIRVGKGLNVKETKKLTKNVVQSVINNPNTMIWLSRLRIRETY